MQENVQLHQVTGEEIAEELNGYGIPIVAVAFPLPKFAPTSMVDVNRFVVRHALSPDTPFINMRNATVFSNELRIGDDEQTLDEVWALGWRYMAARRMEPELVHGQIVRRLEAGKPVTLIPQTARVLQLEAADACALPLSKVDRLLFKWTVVRALLIGKPSLIRVASKGGWPSQSRPQSSLYRHSPVERFTPIRRRVVFRSTK